MCLDRNKWRNKIFPNEGLRYPVSPGYEVYMSGYKDYGGIRGKVHEEIARLRLTVGSQEPRMSIYNAIYRKPDACLCGFVCLCWFGSILSALTGSKHWYGVGRIKRWEDKHSVYIIHNHSGFLIFPRWKHGDPKPWTETNVWYRNIIPGPSFIPGLDLYLSAYIKLLFMFSIQDGDSGWQELCPQVSGFCLTSRT